MLLGDFQKRLNAWVSMRNRVQPQDPESCLNTINRWWCALPWVAYSLHWDDRRHWPNPWQLLDETRWCSLARGLGIMYTIAMLTRQDFEDAVLVETDLDNLVLIHNRKYILNWDPDVIVNINPGTIKNTKRQVDLAEIRKWIR